MICKNCGATIPDNAAFCGVCGVKSEAAPAKNTANDPDVTVSYFSNETPPHVSSDENVNVNPEAGSDCSYNPYFDNNYSEPPKKKKKGKKALKIVCIIVAIAVVIGALGYVFRDYLLNAYYSLRDPEIHQAYVYKRASEELATNLTDSLYKILDGYKDKTVSGNATINVNDQALELVGAGNIPVNSMSIDFSFTNKDDKLALDLGANASIISLGAEARVDIENEKVTLDIPGISKSPLGLSFEDIEEMADMGDLKIAKMIEVIPALIPEQDLVVELVGAYVETAVAAAEDVERRSETLKANGVSDEYTCFITKISEETGIKAGTAMLEKIKEDDDIKDYIIESCGSLEGLADLETIFGEDISDPDEAYDLFIESVDDLIEECKDAEPDSETMVTLKTYIDAKGDIMGIELLNEDGETLRVAMLKDDTAVGIELSYYENEDDEPVFAILGEGEHIGNTFNGTVSVEVNGDQLATIDIKNLNTDLLSDGYFEGEISAQLTKEGVKQISDEFDLDGYEDILSNLRFVIKGKSLEEEVDLKIALSMGGTEFVGCKIEGSIKDAENVEMHSGTVNDLDEWVDQMDRSKIFSAMAGGSKMSFVN